jgi:predicted GNAT family acetyltransferase
MDGAPSAREPDVMDVRAHDDRDRFAAAVGAMYSADPVRHTLAISVIARFFPDPAADPVMFTVHRGGELYGAAFRTPPWPLIISGLPVDAAPATAELLAAVDPDVPGVNGPRELAEGFARAWAEHTGAGLREAMAGRLYELGDLVVPTAPGSNRPATADDVPLLVGWRKDFQIEALGHDREHGRGEQIIRGALDRGERQELWEHEGEVVSWAHAGVPTDGMSRIGPVYTPPGKRGRGYGSAVTAAVSGWAREAGARHVLLFTDLANPTSNSIYQKIGYRPVSDICEIEFTPAP